MKPPHATNKSKKQKERPPRADGRSSATSPQPPSQTAGNERNGNAPEPTIEPPHRPHHYRRCHEDEIPSVVTVNLRRRPCNACRRKRIKCRHARTQPQSLCETRMPSSGPESDASSEAAGTSVPALQEASDVAGDTSSSSDDGDRSISRTPFTRFKEDLSRAANPTPWILDSLSDGSDVRWATKDGTIDFGPHSSLDPFDEDLAVDGSCLSRKDAQLSSYIPRHGSESIRVFVTRTPIPNTLTWRLADNRTGVTMPLRSGRNSAQPSRSSQNNGERRSRRAAASTAQDADRQVQREALSVASSQNSTQPSRSSQNKRERRPRRAVASTMQDADGQVQRAALSVASGPPSAHSVSQAPYLDDLHPPLHLRARFSQPEPLPVPTQFYPPSQDFGDSYNHFPAASNEANMAFLAEIERRVSHYHDTNHYLQQQHDQEPQQYASHMMDGVLDNGHDHRASSASTDYGEQTQNFNNWQERLQCHPNLNQYAPNALGGFPGEGQHLRASSAPTNLQDHTPMVPNLPEQYPLITYQYFPNTGASFLGDGEHLRDFSAPTYNSEDRHFGHNFGEIPMVPDTAAFAAEQGSQFDYDAVRYPDPITNTNISPQSADVAQGVVGPYGNTMTSQPPISDTSTTNLPSLHYESNSMPSDPSPEAQDTRSTVSGFSQLDEGPTSGLGGPVDVPGNGYLVPPAGPMPTSTNDAVPGLDKLSYQELLYEDYENYEKEMVFDDFGE